MNPPQASTPERPPTSIRELCLRGSVLLVVRGAVLAVAAVALYTRPELFDRVEYIRFFHANYGGWPRVAPTLRTGFMAWDAAHYLALAHRGYLPNGGPELAFYPLWPYAIRAVSLATGLHRLAAALVAAQVFSVTGMLLAHRWAETITDRITADVTLALLALSPASMFFSFAYSEALFLLLAMAVLVALARADLRRAAVVSTLLPLARPVGIFILLPLLWTALHRERSVRALRWAVFPLVGYALYFGLMAAQVGDPLAGFAIQRQFVAHASALALLSPGSFVRTFVHIRAWFAPLGGAIDRIAFVWFALASLALVRAAQRDRTWSPWVAWSLCLGIVSAVTNRLLGFDRFLVVIVPVYLVTAMGLCKLPRGVVTVLLGALYVLQLWFAVRYVSWRWVG